MGYIQIIFKIPKDRKLKVGYRTKDSGEPFAYLSRYLEPFETPYYITDVPDGAYEVEISSIKSGTDKRCGKPQYYFTGTTSQSALPLTSLFRIGVERSFSETAGLLFYEFKSDTPLVDPVTIKGITLYTYYPSDPTPFTSAHTFTVNIPAGVTNFRARPFIAGVSVNTKILYTCYNTVTPAYSKNRKISITNIPVCGTIPHYDSGPNDMGAQTPYSPVPGYSE